MRKTALALCAALSTATASAESGFALDASAGSWQPAYFGDIGVNDFDAKKFSLKKNGNIYLQAALEHPIPILPNLMVTHSRIKTRGSELLDDDVTFGGDETFQAGQDIKAQMKLNHTDATLYYRVIDSAAKLNLGVTAREYRGFFQAVGKSHPDAPEPPNPATTEHLKLRGVVPMLYGKARFDLPLGFSLIAEGNATGYEGDHITDLTAKVRWDIAPVVDFGIEAGYRKMRLDVAKVDDLQADLEIEGPYLGLNMRL